MTPKRRDGQPNIQMKIVEISKQAALNLLATNHENRKLRVPRINRYAAAMKAGRWSLAQPLLVDEDGKLIDGQHRLRAVVQCGRPTFFIVLSGFPRDITFCRIDDVAPRSLADWLEQQHEAFPSTLATVIRYVWQLENGYVPASGAGTQHQKQLTPPVALEFLEEHPMLRLAVSAPGVVNTLMSRAMAAFLWYLFQEKDRTAADAFFVDLITKEDFGDRDPMTHLRSQLEQNRFSRQKRTQTEIAALAIKAWNAAREGRPMELLTWRSAGPTREPFPKVV